MLAGAALVLVARAADVGKVVDALSRADPFWLAAAALGVPLSYAGFVPAFRAIARTDGGPELRWWSATRVVGLRFGAVVVVAAGGMAVDGWALYRAGEDAHGSARRVLALDIARWTLLGVFAAAAGAASLAVAAGVPLVLALGWLVGVPLCVVAARAVSGGSLGDRLARLPRDDPPDERGLDAGAWAEWARVNARKATADVAGALRLVRLALGSPGRYPGALAGFALYWLADFYVLFAALHAFGVDVGVAPMVLAYATAHLLTLTPLPAGASGGVEAALAGLLALVGAALAPALLAAYAFRVFVFWVPIGIALAFVPTLGSLNEELPRDARG